MSSSHNYMDNVPVKISEKYKPPPRIFQLPQAIANKLALPENHYENSPQYAYDFQLEHKALAKMPEWRRVREREREARLKRKAKREEQRLRQAEQQQRRLLGAVSYPNAEELSSSASSDDETEAATTSPEDNKTDKIEQKMPIVVVNSFNDILQPTILRQYQPKEQHSVFASQETHEKKADALNNRSAKRIELASSNCDENNKLKYTFNYKDFEEDTSSPFDSIALKAINDLDVLAQVLHNTQLNTNTVDKLQKKESDAEEKEDTDYEQNVESSEKETTNETAASDSLKIALASVGYSDVCNMLQQQTAIANANDIPPSSMQPENFNLKNSNMSLTPFDKVAGNIPVDHYQQPMQHFIKAPQHAAFQMQESNGIEQKNSNLNYLYYHNSVGAAATPAAFNTNFLYHHPEAYSNSGWPQQPHGIHNFLHNANMLTMDNAKSMHTPSNTSLKENSHFHPHYMPEPNTKAFIHDTQVPSGEEPGIAVSSMDLSKSKSVPDILKELKDEIHNSEQRRRRGRNYSVNDGDAEDDYAENAERSSLVTSKQTRATESEATNKAKDQDFLVNMEEKAKNLALNISSMGFPIERVTKAFQLFGTDDKKIIEHLIPLGELLDLGFEECKISEALLKFDNNKDKALEYLIT